MTLGKELNKEIYNRLVAGTCLEILSLDELIDIAITDEKMNPGKNKIWEFAGTYYKYSRCDMPEIIIDREQTVGGYNNSELKLYLLDDNTIHSNDKKFEEFIYSKIAEKDNKVNL